jgi:hypothetical protein
VAQNPGSGRLDDWADGNGAPDPANVVVPGRAGQGWPPGPRDYARPDVVGEPVIVDVKDGPTPSKTFLESKYVADNGLAPNTLYHVPGRGDFYTDGTGKVAFVEATYGGKALNQDLHKPLPDVTWCTRTSVTVRWVGRATLMCSSPTARGARSWPTLIVSRGDAVRSEHTQTKTGKEGGDGYDGGHSYGTWAGGGGEYLNITAQLREINQNYPTPSTCSKQNGEHSYPTNLDLTRSSRWT